MNERGQTASDYVIGMSLLLVTILGVFGAIQGGVYEPFEDPVDGDERTMSNELSDTLINEHRTMGAERTLDNDTLNATLTNETRFNATVTKAGIPDVRRQVNVTIQNESGIVQRATHDDSWRDRPSATSVRVVKMKGFDKCTDSCQLVVRVWTR